MKELSIEEKAKRYDDAIKKAESLYKASEPMSGCNVIIETLFPELKESEDERIRKELIDFVKSRLAGFPQCEKFIAWLEKQGDDKVEQKFKIGDWVVFNNKHQSIYQVEKIEDGYYILRHTHGGTFRVCVLHDESLRPWTIQDAKDGDVLACNEEILLFKSYSVQGRISLYCWYNGQTNNFHSKEVVDTLMTTRNKICPATKEQRDTLIKAMTDAGYTFDFEKKELKKIEPKPWSEEDERMYRGLHNLIYSTSYCDSRKEFSDFLNSLKDRVQIKPQQEWSEDDEKE